VRGDDDAGVLEFGGEVPVKAIAAIVKAGEREARDPLPRSRDGAGYSVAVDV
jgi:hypothetical protein